MKHTIVLLSILLATVSSTAQAASDFYTQVSANDHFFLAVHKSLLDPADGGATPAQAGRPLLTKADITRTLGWLEEAYEAETVALGYPQPHGKRFFGRIIVRVYDDGVDETTMGWVANADGVIHLNAWKMLPAEANPGALGTKPWNKGDYVMKVTAAHELFHAIQSSFDQTKGRWLAEATAQWVESAVHPDNADAVGWEVEYIKRPWLSYHLMKWDEKPDGTKELDYSQGRPYGSSAFIRFLTKHHPKGNALVREIWNHTGAVEGPHGLASVVKAVAEVPVPRKQVLDRSSPVLSRVELGGPLEEAGFEVGDKVTSINGRLLTNAAEGLLAFRDANPGRTYTIGRVRGETHQYFTIAPEARSVHNPEDDTFTKKVYWGGRFRPDGTDVASATLPRQRYLDPEAPIFGVMDQEVVDKFRHYFDRFAVGCLMMDIASPEYQIADYLYFRQNELHADYVDDPDSADPDIVRPPFTELPIDWEDELGLEDDAIRYFAFGPVDVPSADLARLSGLGIGYYALEQQPTLPSDVPLHVSVKAGENEISFQAIQYVADKWAVLPSYYDADSGVHRIGIDRFGDSFSGVFLVVVRYADDTAPGNAKVYPVTVVLGEPPIVRSVTLEQEGKAVWKREWIDVHGDEGHLVQRQVQGHSTGIDSSTDSVTVKVTFSHGVRPYSDTPLVELDGEPLVLQSEDDGVTWIGTAPTGKLATQKEPHTLRIRAESTPAYNPNPLPLDENPLTIARGTDNRWEDYEHGDEGVLIAIDLEATPPEAEVAMETYQPAGDSGNHAVGAVRVEVAFDQLQLTAVDYAPMALDGDYEGTCRWLIRFDYGGRVAYQVARFGGGAFEREGVATAKLQYSLPVEGTTDVKARFSVYTGGIGKPVFSGEGVLPIKPLEAKELPVKTLAKLEKDFAEWEEKDNALWAKYETTSKPKDLADWVNNYAELIAKQRTYYGFIVVMAYHEQLRSSLKERIDLITNMDVFIKQNYFHRVMSNYFNLFYGGMLYEELDLELMRWEAIFQQGNEFTKKRINMAAGETMRALGDYYAKVKLDADKAFEVYKRWQVLRAVSAPVKDIAFMPMVEEARKAREFYAPDAFAE